MTVGQSLRDLESGVEILPRIIDLHVVIPVEDEEIDAKIVRHGQLLLDRTRRVILPSGKGLAILIRPKRQTLEVNVGKGTGPAVEIVGTDAGLSLGRGGRGWGNDTRNGEA